jgi:hypothetical protein
MVGPENKHQLSPRQRERVENFNSLREGLLAKGFAEKILTVSMLKANLMVFVTTLPAVLVLYGLYIIVNGVERRSYGGSGFLFILALLLGIVLHELIHGTVWAVYCKNKWQSVHFGVNWATLTPYCHCAEALSIPKYAIGCAMPTILLGFLPYLFGLAFNHLPIAHFGLLFILAGGGDAYILWLIRKEKHSLILDHPYLVGCIVFYPNRQACVEQ